MNEKIQLFTIPHTNAIQCVNADTITLASASQAHI